MDSGTSAYEKILVQCKSNDVDAKVEALSKLQAHFGKGIIEVPDSEALINILKSSLRTSNFHLTNATLSVLPVVLPSLITRSTHAAQFLSNASLAVSSSTSSVSSGTFDIPVLRSALGAFLPAGGVIDRLGDKERAQAKARETLVLLGGYAFRAGGSTVSAKSSKGQETPLAFFERVLKEAGLASKVWKVREQSILSLVHMRRAHHLFPIRPYLTLLVDCLEDTDAHVRDCARQSVVELFTGPAVNDAARADLKKEMTKKGVRKAIVDDVLGKLLNKVSNGTHLQNEESENGDTTGGKKEYVPPSLALQGKRQRVLSQTSNGQSILKEASRPASRAANKSPPPPATPSAENAEITPVYIASSRDLESEFAAMQKPFEGKETEHNWAARERAVQRVRGMLKGDVRSRYPEPFLLALKDGFMQWSLKTLASLRTTVAINTCLLYAELAVALGSLLDPHCEILLSNLLKMSAFTKKITAQQSQASVTIIISHTSAQPRLVIPLLWTTLQEKTVQSRAYAVAHFKHYLEMHGQRSKHAIETSGNLDTLEKAVKKSLADSNPGVRESARTMYWVFTDVWKERGLTIINTLDATARKQLEKICPFPEVQVSLPSTPDVTKKTSVAAAIAASRAKARAISTAPPTLRHQATSNATGPWRAGSPSMSPMSNARSHSPLRPSTSPPSPTQSRLASAGLLRSTSVGIIPSTSLSSHTRRTSGGSETNARSVSPAFSDGAHRRISSPLVIAATGATIRKTMGTLTTSPPSSPPNQKSPTHAPLPNQNGTVTVPARLSLAQLTSCDDESLMMAQRVHIPDDSESEDGAINVLSFSAAYHQLSPEAKSPSLTLSPASDSRPTPSNALSTGSISDINAPQQQVVEDALRARAEQAESAAERLLELVEPEDDLSNHPILPPSLLKTSHGSGNAAPKPRPKPIPIPVTPVKVPQTPDNRARIILKKAALFTDSPAQKSTSLLDVLRNQKQETGWWMKRKMILSQVPTNFIAPSERIQEFENAVSALERGVADVDTLRSLALLCLENSVADLSPPTSPRLPSKLSSASSEQLKHAEMWEKNKTFDKFFKALMSYLQPTRTEDELAYGLIVAWEVLENLSYFLEGKESELFGVVLRVRYCNKITVLEGTNAIRDALTSKLDPVYGLTTLHGNLKAFNAEPAPSSEGEEIKSATYAFGLMAVGKFILRLPAEIAEEELPRLKTTIITSLNNRSSLIVRESAAAAIVAAQLVLRDETHLFTLLDGLADEKKNLLTYLFDKHGARRVPAAEGPTGMEKLEREMRRLDTRTSTPLRSGL